MVVSLSFFLTSCYSFIGRYQSPTAGQHAYSDGSPLQRKGQPRDVSVLDAGGVASAEG